MQDIKLQKGLPVDAKRVFKGEIFEIWQWEQKMFDGTTQAFEKAWRFPTVEIIATVGEKILIEEQDQPDRTDNITLVSGRADRSDDMLSEAKRELMEETGYQSDDWELFLKHERDGKILHDTHYFVARNCKKAGEQHLDAGEKIKTKLVTFEDFLKLTEKPNFWVSPEFVIFLLRIQLDEKKKKSFKKLLFP